MNTKTLLFFALAGLVSGLLFIVVATNGSLLSFPFLLLTPVPIAIVSLGWGTLSGFGAAFVGGLFILILSSPFAGALYLGFIGLPVAYLAHCVGLSRNDSQDGEVAGDVAGDVARDVEWFPLDQVFLRAALIASIVPAIAMIAFEFNPDQMFQLLSGEFTKSPIMEELNAQQQASLTKTLQFAISIMPYTMPIVWLMVLISALFVGAWVSKRSNLLLRPWPDFGYVDLPSIGILMFAAGLVTTFFGHPISTYGAPFVGVFGMAYSMIGFGIIHVVTRGMSGRRVMLLLLYVATLILTIPGFVMLGLGLIEQKLNLRERHAAKYPPKGGSGTSPPPSIH